MRCPDRPWTTRKLARLMGVAEATAARWCREGRIRALRRGRRWLVPAEEGERLLAGGAMR